MTVADRLEQRLPELMAELAPARVPDYFDDMLRQSARIRQRPAWSALERWLPMGVIARTDTVRHVPWRPILVAVLVLIAAAAALALTVGSRRPAVPPPFGPAGNGSVLISEHGDILALDPVSGITRPVVSASALDEYPLFAPDGRTFLFVRMTDEPGIWVANADGTNAHRVLERAGEAFTWIDWSQDGSRIVAVDDHGDGATISLVDPADGSLQVLSPMLDVGGAPMPFGSDELVLHEPLGDNWSRFWRTAADGSRPRQLAASPFAIGEPFMSPDGTRFVYATWQDGLGNGGNLRVFDLATGVDSLVTPRDNDTFLWQDPQFLPDGRAILASRWKADGTFQLAVVPADGSPDRGIGPVRTQDSGGASYTVSPDGRIVFASYHDNGAADGKVWRIDVATGDGTLLPWADPADFTWQRVANQDRAEGR